MPAIIYVCIDPNLRPTTHNMRPYLCGINRRIHNKGTETDKKKAINNDRRRRRRRRNHGSI